MLAIACVEACDDIGIDEFSFAGESSMPLEVDCCSFLSTTVWPLFMAGCIGPSFCRRGRSASYDRRVQKKFKKGPEVSTNFKTGISEPKSKRPRQLKSLSEEGNGKRTGS